MSEQWDGKTPRHPAEDARDFWHKEATRRLKDLDKARRELADLERHFGEQVRKNTNLAAELDLLREALRLADAALSGANMNMGAVEKKVRAALRERDAADYATVPKEPTQGMLDAGEAAYFRKITDMASVTPTEHHAAGGGPMGYAYRAMLSAAKEDDT
jgi:septal ring factor EnvC (AmiA/AmiB activator)